MLNELERAQADAYGWDVCEVYDLKTRRVTVQVLPTARNEIKSADTLLKVVIHRAQNRDVFAQRVLKLVMDSIKAANEPARPNRKK